MKRGRLQCARLFEKMLDLAVEATVEIVRKAWESSPNVFRPAAIRVAEESDSPSAYRWALREVHVDGRGSHSRHSERHAYH